MKKEPQMEYKLHFLFERETKGAVRYQEVDEHGKPATESFEGHVVGALYIRKTAIKQDPPKHLIITITDKDTK